MDLLIGLLDGKLLAAIVVISIPFALAAASRIFGSLREFWGAEKSTWRTPSEVAEDTAKELLFPWTSRRMPFGDDRIWPFWVGYVVAVLAAYSIVRVHLPSVARLLSNW